VQCFIKYLTGFCSTEGQELFVALFAGVIGLGLGSWTTSSSHCSYPVSVPDGPGSMPHFSALGCGCVMADNNQGSCYATPERCHRCSIQCEKAAHLLILHELMYSETIAKIFRLSNLPDSPS
jgi:hypothetical protein